MILLTHGHFDHTGNLAEVLEKYPDAHIIIPEHTIPSVIVEHAFLDDDGDYEDFLSDDDKLKALARADARGIARYYGLKSKKEGSVLDPLNNVKEKKVLVVDEDYRHNIISYETYFQDERKEKGGKQTDPEVEAIIKKFCSCLIPYLQIR